MSAPVATSDNQPLFIVLKKYGLFNGLLSSLSVTENTIATTGKDAHGVRLGFGSFVNLASQAIQGNTITTKGVNANGIHIVGNTNILPSSPFDAAALKAGNNIGVSDAGAQEVVIIP